MTCTRSPDLDLALIGKEGASLAGDEFYQQGIALIRLSNRFATLDFKLLRQRGRMPTPCRDLIRWITEVARSA